MNTAWKEKFENFWYYYKWHCILAVIALLGVLLLVDFFTQPETDLNISLTSVGALSEETLDFNDALPNLIVDANGDGQALITISRQFITENFDSEDNREHISKLNNQLANKGATLYIVDQVNFDRLIQKDAFCSIDEWMDVRQYGERVVYRNGEPMALSLSGSRVLQEMGFTDDNLYALLLFRRPGDEQDKLVTMQYENAAKVMSALMEQANQ